MKKKHFYTAVILFSLLVAGVQPALAISIPGNYSYYKQDGNTYTLEKNVYGTIYIMSDGITLDGDGYTITPTVTEKTYGISVSNKTGITIMNVNIEKNAGGLGFGGFGTGINILQSDNITLTSNTVSTCYHGIRLAGSSDNAVTYNTVESSGEAGIFLYNCSSNYLKGNTLKGSSIGIYLEIANNSNKLINNIVSDNSTGIQIRCSSNNTVTGNTFSSNSWGIRIRAYYRETSIDNQVYNNNFFENTNTPGQQAEVFAKDSGVITGNVFNQDLPIGGNYWSDWTGSGPYTFTGGQDDLPWTVQDGWSAPVNQPPVADAGPDQTVEQESYEGTEVTLDGSGSTDPDSTPGTNDDIVIFDWYEGDTFLGSGETINYTFPLGSHTVTLKVTDSFGETDEDEVIITVVDTTSPEVACSVNPEVLWQPKNHRMVPVVVFIEAIVICTETDDLTLVVTAESSEPDDYKGDGAFTGDVDGADGFTGPVDVSYAFSPDIGGFVGVIDLRAERDGRGVDRIYTITAIVKHASGNETTASCDVTVPYDQGEGKKGKEKKGKGKK